MAKRFQETVNMRQVSGNVGGVEASLSLANKLEGFKQQAVRFGEEQAVKRGVESAKQTELKKTDINGQQVTQKPAMMQDSFFGSIERQAHNKTLRAAYAASLDSDNRNAITSFATQHKDNIVGFNEAVAGYKAGVLDGVDPSIRQAAEIDLNGRIDGARIKVYEATISRQKKENEGVINANAIGAADEAYRHARNGDTALAEEELIKAGLSIDELDLPADVKAKRKREVMREYDENSRKHEVDVVIANGGLSAAVDKVAEWEEEVPKGWTPDEWDKFIEGEQVDLNKKLNAEIKAAKEVTAKAAKVANFEAIEKRHSGDDSQIINPKELDEYYLERVAPMVEDMPLELKQSNQAAFIDRMKMIPKSLKAQVTNAVNSNNPDLLKEAAMLVDRIDGIRGVVEQIPVNEQAYLTNVVGLLENMDASEAIDLARRATDPKDKARIEVAQQRLDDIDDKPSFYKDKAQAAFDGGYLGFQTKLDDVSGAQLAKEYRAVYDNAVLAGMNEADATTKANNTVERLWGVDSTFGTDRAMKYPPANYYSVNGDTGWVRKEAVKEANAMVAGGGIKAEDIVLMANDSTARSATILEPTYSMKVMIDGAFHNLGQWKPDLSKEKSRIRLLNTKEGAALRVEAFEEKARVDALDFGVAP